MNRHIVKSYDAEFKELDRLTAHMGGLAEKLLADAFAALERRDPNLAAATIASDKSIDTLDLQVQERAILMIAKRQPIANDLRHIMTVLKITSDLERIGDLAKNIAKRVALMDQTRSIEAIPLLMSMSSIVAELIHDALDSFAARDAELAVRVTVRDKNVDDFYNSIFRTLVTFMMENPKYISESAHLLFVAKNLERMGDHATNIAEMVYYVVTGEHMEERERGEQPEDGAAEQEQG